MDTKKAVDEDHRAAPGDDMAVGMLIEVSRSAKIDCGGC
jgi:hypothetical protein